MTTKSSSQRRQPHWLVPNCRFLGLLVLIWLTNGTSPAVSALPFGRHRPTPSPSLPPVWVINLDRDTDRWAAVEAELRQRHVQDAVHRFSAIHGRTLSAEDLRTNTTAVARRFLTRGIVGCFLSHRSQWQRIASDPRHECQIIMEDDVVLSEDFVQDTMAMLAELDACPETKDYQWDVLLLGALGSVHPQGRYGLNRIASYMAGGQRRTRQVTTHIHVPRRPMGMHCYVLTRRGARKLLQQASRVAGHVDVIAWGLRNLTLLACHPMLAHQAMTAPSTIGAVTVGLETRLPSVRLDAYTGISFEWIFNAPVLRLGSLVLTMGRSVLYVILGYIVAWLLWDIAPWWLWIHSACFAFLFVVTKLTTIPATL